ncbi:DsbA family protein [Sulfurovum sp. CS9]|uniref:DsbA family protein n=1 Tax=Sulfurovum sp. CS9 TaxID=3391146 RepID=UPI0039EB9088
MLKKEIIFVIDPMCSWCWGFAPVIEQLRATQSDKYDFSLVVGGLRTKGEMAWDESSKRYLKGHWEEVAKRTGQPFSNALFEKEDFEYDTYPACKAVVTVRALWGDEKSFDYLHRLQKAFYDEGNDITKLDVLSKLLEETVGDARSFRDFYHTPRAELLMQHDFSKARSMGANAFPSVVIIDTDGHMVCQKGYRSILEMKKILES